jgi:hypothetical protein
MKPHRFLSQLEHAQRALAAALPAEPLPWGYAIFVVAWDSTRDASPMFSRTRFRSDFAQRVYTARLDDADLEAFVVATTGDHEATALAQRFANGFREYGEDGGTSGGAHWARDRYLGTFSMPAPPAAGWSASAVRQTQRAERPRSPMWGGRSTVCQPKTARRAASEAASGLARHHRSIIVSRAGRSCGTRNHSASRTRDRRRNGSEGWPGTGAGSLDPAIKDVSPL